MSKSLKSGGVFIPKSAFKQEDKAESPFNAPDKILGIDKLFQKGMVIPNFEYQGIIMDFAVIVTDRLIEIHWVESKEEYAKELSAIGRAGRISFDKHKSIQSGKFISNAFYFMTPGRILTVDELPPKYGLIVPDKETWQWKFRKEADWIDPEAYLQKSFYKTLAEKLAKKLYK